MKQRLFDAAKLPKKEHDDYLYLLIQRGKVIEEEQLGLDNNRTMSKITRWEAYQKLPNCVVQVMYNDEEKPVGFSTVLDYTGQEQSFIRVAEIIISPQYQQHFNSMVEFLQKHFNNVELFFVVHATNKLLRNPNFKILTADVHSEARFDQQGADWIGISVKQE